MRTNSLPKNLILGAVGGLAASYAMTQFQSAWTVVEKKLARSGNKQQQSEGDDATVKTADAISRQVVHQPLRAKDKKWAGPAVHYAFGTLVGAIYGALSRVTPRTRAGLGTAYGTAVWLAADEVAVPALGLAEPPAKTPVNSHIKALASHLIYGLTTDLTMRTMQKATARR